MCSGSCDKLRHILSTDVAKLRMLQQAASGLVAIHELGIVHRDIALRNVLLREGDAVHAMISDLGLSRSLEHKAQQDGGRTTSQVGPVRWMAPVSRPPAPSSSRLPPRVCADATAAGRSPCSGAACSRRWAAVRASGHELADHDPVLRAVCCALAGD